MNDLASAAVERAWLPLVPFGLQLFFGLVALGVLAGTWYSSSGIATPKRLALLSFRAVALSVLAWVVAGPHTVRSEERSVRDPLVVLLDASESMAIEDVEGKTRAAAVGAWLREQETAFADLAEAYDLRWFLVDGGLRPWLGGGSGDGASLRPLGVLREGLFLSGGDVASAFSGDATPSRGKNTDLGLGLLSLRDALDGAVPAGVLLVSDGGDRGALARAQAGGDGRVEALVQELGYPVSTWTVGQPEGPRDQGIRSFEGPPFGFVRRPLKLWAELSSQGLGDGPVVVVLRADGEVVASQEVRWDGESSTTLGFEIKPDQVGFVTYSLDLPLAAEDAIPSNNLAELTVKVLRDRTRVLQLTSHPSWDVKMLRRLLKTDPNVDLVCFFILRGHNGGALARRGPLSLIPFPFDELFFEDLQGFDLVVFHNFSFRSFTQQAVGPFYEAVRSYVEEGGAFLVVGGDESLGEAQVGLSGLVPILPAQVPAGPYLEGIQVPRLGPAGSRHPVTRLDRFEGENKSIWGQLPPLEGHNPLGPLLPGGVSLLEGQGGQTLAAVRSVGRGRSMIFASDSSWRWKLAGPDAGGGEGAYSRFWRNVVRWLIKDVEQKQVQVGLDRENPPLGQPVTLQIQVLQSDYAPLPATQISAAVKPVEGGPSIHLQGKTDALGRVTLPVQPPQAGSYDVEVSVPSIDGPYGAATARFTVQDPQGEFSDPRSRPQLLEAVSRATGGHVLQGTSPDPRRISRRRQRLLQAFDRSAEPDWNRPWVLLLLVVPLGIEWTLRRRLGLR